MSVCPLPHQGSEGRGSRLVLQNRVILHSCSIGQCSLQGSSLELMFPSPPMGYWRVRGSSLSGSLVIGTFGSPAVDIRLVPRLDMVNEEGFDVLFSGSFVDEEGVA